MAKCQAWSPPLSWPTTVARPSSPKWSMIALDVVGDAGRRVVLDPLRLAALVGAPRGHRHHPVPLGERHELMPEVEPRPRDAVHEDHERPLAGPRGTRSRPPSNRPRPSRTRPIGYHPVGEGDLGPGLDRGETEESDEQRCTDDSANQRLRFSARRGGSQPFRGILRQLTHSISYHRPYRVRRRPGAASAVHASGSGRPAAAAATAARPLAVNTVALRGTPRLVGDGHLDQPRRPHDG